MKREHALLLYLLKSNKKKVEKLHVFRAPKNVHVADVVRLPFGYFFDSTRTNLIEWHKHHVDCAQEERTCFAFVFIEIKQKESGKIACFSGAQNSHVGDVALIAFRQYFDSSPTNFIECQQHHAE